MKGIKLSQFITSNGMELEPFLELAILLARTLQYEHRELSYLNCLHPENILIQSGQNKAVIMKEAISAPAYWAPEQSGVANRLPDGRSDLYTLGIILYELLTGHLPYPAEEPVNWEMIHLTSSPVPITHYREDCPLWLEHILRKLLTKDMKQRYASASSLLRDLKAHHAGTLDPGIDHPLPSPGLLDPGHLISRIQTAHVWTRELTRLHQSWEKVAPERGKLVWITGAKGSGKTTLIQHFIQPIRQKAAVIEAQAYTNQDLPFGAIASILQSCFLLLWSEPPAAVEQACKMIRQQLPDWRGIPLLQKELGQLMGQQAPSQERTFSEQETEAAFVNLIRILSQRLGPLVIVIDNLEQRDSRSRLLLQQFGATGDAIENVLLLVGTRALEQLHSQSPDLLSAEYDQITLAPLSYKDVYKYMSTVLGEKSARVHPLSRLLYEQTGGELAMLASQVTQWVQQQTLILNDDLRWSWSEDLLFSSNQMEIEPQLFYAEFMLLSEQARLLLQYASCFHTHFDGHLLLPLTQQSPEQLQALLSEVEEEGYLARTRDNKHYFIYKQAKQYIYNSEPQQHGVWHYQLARCLGQQLKKDSPLFSEEVVRHWNLAQGLSSEEVEQRARFNYQAMKYWQDCREFVKCKEAAKLTIHYIEANPASPLRSVLYHAQLTLARAQYITGEMEQAKELLYSLLEDSENPSVSEQVDAYELLMQIHAFDDNPKAVRFHQKALSLLGWEMKFRPSPAAMLVEILRTQITLNRYKDGIEALPTNEEGDYLRLCDMAIETVIPQLIENPTGLLHFYARFIRHGLKKGINRPFSVVLGGYALLLERFLPHLSRLPGSDNLKQIGLQSLERMENKLVADYWKSLHLQTRSPKQSSEYMRQAMYRGIQEENLHFANFAWISLILISTETPAAMESLVSFYEEHLLPVTSAINREIYQITRQYTQALRQPEKAATFIQTGLSPELIPLHEKYDNFECLCKLEVAYLAGSYDIASVWAREAGKTEFIYDHSRIRKQRIYEWLILISHYEQQHEGRRIFVQLLRRALRQIQQWKGLYGEHSSVHEFFRAEWSKAHGQQTQAVLRYQEAARLAGSEQLDWLEGIIHERLSLCYHHDSRNQLLAIVDACAAYSRRGIDFKVSLLQQKYADLFQSFSQAWENHASSLKLWHKEEGLEVRAQSDSQPSLNEEAASFILELPTDTVKQEQAQLPLAQLAETSLMFRNEYLLQDLLEQTIQQTGASGGMMMMWSEAQPRIMATPSWSDTQAYPSKLLRYTATTGEWTTLPDANLSLFASDDYIRSVQPQALLCAPITIPGMPDMLLYLENRYLANVFTERDKLIIELLISRMIYLEMLSQPEEGSADKAKPAARAYAPATLLVEPLTVREEEILSAMAEGLSNKDIAIRLGIAETTVKTHATNLFGKLDVKRRGQAVARAKELGLLQF